MLKSPKRLLNIATASPWCGLSLVGLWLVKDIPSGRRALLGIYESWVDIHLSGERYLYIFQMHVPSLSDDRENYAFMWHGIENRTCFSRCDFRLGMDDTRCIPTSTVIVLLSVPVRRVSNCSLQLGDLLKQRPVGKSLGWLGRVTIPKLPSPG